MLGEVVVDDERVLAVVAEVFAHRGGGEGSEVLHRRGLGGGGGDDDGVGHRAVLFERLHDLRNGRALLADGAVDADQVVLRGVDDGVERDGGLAGLAVADEQLALAAADGDHRVDGLDAGGHGLAHGLTVDDAGGETLDGEVLVGVDGALVVDGLTERVDDAANHGFADGHGHDLAGALDGVAFLDLGVVAEEHGADLVFVEVHGEAGYVVGELNELAGHDLVEAVDAGDTVAEGDDGADFVDLDALLVVLNLLAKQLCYLTCLDLCHVFLLLYSYQF